MKYSIAVFKDGEFLSDESPLTLTLTLRSKGCETFPLFTLSVSDAKTTAQLLDPFSDSLAE